MTHPEVLGDALIPVINKLQDIFSQVSGDVKLPLPQVAVVGSQSSGKSSVLESLVGRDFLPRGSDIVTRRPLVLQLVKVPPQSSGRPSEWGEFLHSPGKLFYDFDRIRQEIQAETDRVVGTSKNVSSKAIRLRICSPHLLTMTLIDLPGITKLPTGDQPTNIEQRLRDMVLEYIRQPDCIILAVSSANTDLANSDALQLAQLVDPQGTRTIGVLTKLDIMDRGTNAVHILKNQLFPLRLGYVAVVNRSQEDINKARAMGEARRAEEAFFLSRSEYADVASSCGIANLARRLNAILVTHIRSALPTLRRRIAELTESKLAELREFGDQDTLSTRSAKGAYLLQLLCDYADRYGAMLDGRHQDMSFNVLSGGARIRHVFHEIYSPRLKDLDPGKGMTDAEISTVIKNGAGVSGDLLVPREPFELLVRRAISALLPAALQCKDLVHEELIRIAEQACPPEVGRFPELQRGLAAAVLEFIMSGAEPADRMIRALVDCELDYINQDHPDFIGGRGAVRAALNERTLREQQVKKDEAQNAEAKAAAARRTTPTAGEGAAKTNGTSQNAPVGLKALPDSVSHPPDELLSRVRRRSDDGSRTPDNANGAPPGGHNSTWASFFWGNTRGVGNVEGGLRMPADDMVLGRRAMYSPNPGKVRSESEEVDVDVIRRLVHSYFSIVRRNLTDAVPKAIMHFMVNNTRRGLQQNLIRSLYKDDILDGLLAEREDVVKRRTACLEALETLSAAGKALESVPSELSACISEAVPPIVYGSNFGVSLPLGGMMLAAAGSSSLSMDSNGSGYMTAASSASLHSWGSPAAERYERQPTMTQAARAAAHAVTSLLAHDDEEQNGSL